MIVRELGTRITSVPGIEFIQIEPSAKSDMPAHVLIKFSGIGGPISYGIEEFGQLFDAVALANDRVQWLARVNGRDHE